MPGTTRPGWLINQNKCNQFVGDVLYDAGAAMPTYRMKSGALHYAGASTMHRFNSHFDSVTAIKRLKPGDVMTVKIGKVWHTEVLTKVDLRRGILRAAGALPAGAKERNYSHLLNGLKYDSKNGHWTVSRPDVEIRFLRPKMRR